MLMKVVSRSTIIATIIALVLASISAIGALAASSTGSSGTSQNNQVLSQNEVRDVQAETIFFTHLQKEPIKLSTNASERAQQERWLQQYKFALAQAQAIIAGRFGSIASTSGKTSTSTSSSGTSSSSTSTSGSSVTVSKMSGIGKYYQNNPDKLLALYLHMMRELREKLGMSQ